MAMNCASDKSNCMAKCFKVGLMAVAGIALLGWVVMLLWNCLMPALFSGVQEVGYFQALGLLLLSKILFGGFHGGGHGRCKERQQRWERMTPEEREQLKGHFKGRWGSWCRSEKREDGAPAKPSSSVE